MQARLYRRSYSNGPGLFVTRRWLSHNLAAGKIWGPSHNSAFVALANLRYINALQLDFCTFFYIA